MFDQLAEKLSATFQRLTGRGKLSEDNIKEALREVRRALLEADVHFKVARDFVARIEEKAVGQEVLASLTPGQYVIRLVHNELVTLLGGTRSALVEAPRGTTVILIVGLQGSGKTTFAGKLAALLKRRGRRVTLAACDVYRPAAIDQLEILGKSVGVPVFAVRDLKDPVEIAKRAKADVESHGVDYLLVDTAGRLHVDEELMDELRRMKREIRPHEILLVLDGMTGQDAVRLGETFQKSLGLDGIVLTKMDGDARGGAALSIRQVTGVPIKFVGVGEKLDALEEFHPDRLASRILGMGDVLTLVERAEERIDQVEARKLAEKLRKEEFTLADFRMQITELRKMGPLDEVLGMLPGVGKQMKALKGGGMDESAIGRTAAIIDSMTPAERRHPEILNGSRRKRIARGSGTTVQDVNRLLKEFEEVRRMMRLLKGKRGRMPGMRFPG